MRKEKKNAYKNSQILKEEAVTCHAHMNKH